MENYIKLSTLNDFIFCPKSIYYHEIYDNNFTDKIYHTESQIRGKIVHENIDKKRYSSNKDVLQSLDVFSDEYGICGKIDLFHKFKGVLVERKYQIKIIDGKPKIYYGQKLQLWGQMYCLQEMGYEVREIYIHSRKDNKNHRIFMPSTYDIINFQNIIEDFKKFNVFDKEFTQNKNKCEKCIYKELCDFYI